MALVMRFMQDDKIANSASKKDVAVNAVTTKARGNIGDIVMMGIAVIAMLAVMIGFIDCVDVLQRKATISQLARKYILVAESNGYLPGYECESLIRELESNGVTDVDVSGSTLYRAEYGQAVTVCIKGKINDKYEFTEKRMSTAKY